MMTIQWFPGHMAKATREFQEKLKLVDVVFELLDARIPLSSSNPSLDEIIGDKPRVKILMKSDLADTQITSQWLTYYKENNIAVVPYNAKRNQDVSPILTAADDVLTEYKQKRIDKGLRPRAIRAVSVGIPNVGKSTLINRFAGKNITQTGNRPGVTKAQQWIKYKNKLELLDTPGILWPKFENQRVGKCLAVTGAIKDTLLHLDDVALFMMAYFTEHYPGRLAKRYNFDKKLETEMPLPELLMLITKKRGYRDDYERGAEMMIYEVRKGLLGPFSLETQSYWLIQMIHKTIKEIEALLQTMEDANHPVIKELQNDQRKGVQQALKRWQKKQEKHAQLEVDFQIRNKYEQQLYDENITLIGGVDEVGRGPLAGPVVAACVILDPSLPILGLNDSKQLSATRRKQLVDTINERSLAVTIAQATPEEIDRLNIYQATKLAMERAVAALNHPVEHLLIDAMTIAVDIPQQSIIKGDTHSNSIAAASIIAKEYRDQLMTDFSQQYPAYDFDSNMGYGTPAHLAALRKVGICPIHRRSFEPIKSMVQQ